MQKEGRRSHLSSSLLDLGRRALDHLCEIAVAFLHLFSFLLLASLYCWLCLHSGVFNLFFSFDNFRDAYSKASPYLPSTSLLGLPNLYTSNFMLPPPLFIFFLWYPTNPSHLQEWHGAICWSSPIHWDSLTLIETAYPIYTQCTIEMSLSLWQPDFGFNALYASLRHILCLLKLDFVLFVLHFLLFYFRSTNWIASCVVDTLSSGHSNERTSILSLCWGEATDYQGQ